jgi:hypothetical protein
MRWKPGRSNRRNLTDADILRCVTELDKRKTRAESARIAGKARQSNDPQRCVTLEGPTAAATAETIGVSQRKVEQARTVLDRAVPAENG